MNITFADNPMPLRRYERIKALIREIENSAISMAMLASPEEVQPIWNLMLAYREALEAVKEGAS